jgi:hypothetical protein
MCIRDSLCIAGKDQLTQGNNESYNKKGYPDIIQSHGKIKWSAKIGNYEDKRQKEKDKSRLNVILLNVVRLDVLRLNVILLNVILLNVLRLKQ